MEKALSPSGARYSREREENAWAVVLHQLDMVPFTGWPNFSSAKI